MWRKCKHEPQSACPSWIGGVDRGWLAPALLCPSTSSLRFLPFLPPLETCPSLINHPTPLSSPLLIYSLRSTPHRFRPFHPSFLSSYPVFLLVCPSFVCVSLSLLSTFPLFLHGGLGFHPCLATSLIKRLCLSLSLLLSPACRSVSPPFDTRRSLFARVTHRRGETIRWFPGWHLVSRAAFFLSISLCLFLLSAFITEAVVTVDRSESIRSVDRDETTEVTDVTVNGDRANEGVTGVASN